MDNIVDFFFGGAIYGQDKTVIHLRWCHVEDDMSKALTLTVKPTTFLTKIWQQKMDNFRGEDKINTLDEIISYL